MTKGRCRIVQTKNKIYSFSFYRDYRGLTSEMAESVQIPLNLLLLMTEVGLVCPVLLLWRNFSMYWFSCLPVILALGPVGSSPDSLQSWITSWWKILLFLSLTWKLDFSRTELESWCSNSGRRWSPWCTWPGSGQTSPCTRSRSSSGPCRPWRRPSWRCCSPGSSDWAATSQ